MCIILTQTNWDGSEYCIELFTVSKEAAFSIPSMSLCRSYLDNSSLIAECLWKWSCMGFQLTLIVENTGQNPLSALIQFGERKARNLHFERWANFSALLWNPSLCMTDYFWPAFLAKEWLICLSCNICSCCLTVSYRCSVPRIQCSNL